MTERDAYIQKMEAEQREATARFQELEAQSDLAESEDELDLITGAKERSDDFQREVQALRHAEQQDWHRVKTAAEKARTRFMDHLDRAGLQWDQLRTAYRREREAELRNLGAQMDQWEAAHARTTAEDSLLTRQEIDFMKRDLLNTRSLLLHLGRARGAAWKEAREEYEAAWRDLRERSRRIRADSSTGIASPS
ncbi:hypothetical protein G4177_27150 [Corallococcus sp. ZKHCc1 1396]|uniref:Uncharacterized protein n=1 Tax=Corallococcus soli TaxID=2710757 RepID=A0ABR9PVB0_9BACT|nr:MULTISPECIES: hypothetical protein [Corallococcus]MBE4751851.1 hypothetical protein [Corallococcus soli]MCY1033513.1 hypothetical protein [Corallococcus sp. BB11-1]